MNAATTEIKHIANNFESLAEFGIEINLERILLNESREEPSCDINNCA